MLFQVESADDPSVMCIMNDGSKTKVCGGYFTLNLQPQGFNGDTDFLEVIFQAPSGYEIEMGPLDGLITFEFEAHNTNSRDLNCDGTDQVLGASPNMAGDLSTNKYQIAPRLFNSATADLNPIEIAPEIKPKLVGSSGVEKLTLDSDLSFARVSTCAVYFKIKFSGLSSVDTVRLSQMSFSVQYDSRSILVKEAQEYHYQSSSPMGIKALNPQLVGVADNSTTRSGDKSSKSAASESNSTSSLQGNVAVYESLTNDNSNSSSIRGFVSQVNKIQSMGADAAPSSGSHSVHLVVTACAVAIGVLCNILQY